MATSVHPWMAARALLLGLSLAALATGCTSYSSLRYGPPIQDVELRDQATEARLAIAWRGVEPHEDTHELLFRLRFESLGATEFALEATDFELLDGALAPFGAARAEGLPARVPPNGSSTFTLAFPPAAGRELSQHDLSALCLRVRFADGRWNSSTTFERLVYPARDPYWDSPWSFHFGVLWCD
jgi:hypothetical protein